MFGVTCVTIYSPYKHHFANPLKDGLCYILNQNYIIMRRILFICSIVMLALASSCVSTANLTPEQRAAKEAEKRAEAIADSLQFVKAVSGLESMDFVLEADKLVFKRGKIAYVNTATNFISASNGRAVVQVAPYNGGGPNGVGGITVEGSVTNVDYKTDKRGNALLQMNVTGVGVSATVSITLYKGSNEASAVITPNFNSNRITLEGQIWRTSESAVFKGRSL